MNSYHVSINKETVKTYKVTVNKTVRNYLIRYDGVKRLPVDVTKFVRSEEPMGMRDGINTTFTSLYNFIPNSLELFINGIKQTVAIDYQTIGNNTIALNYSIGEIELININYTKI